MNDLCYTSRRRGALTGMRNSSMGPSRGIDPMAHHAMLTIILFSF